MAGAEAGLLPAAHRQLHRRVVELRVVDAGDPRLDPAGERLAALDVTGPDRGLQPVAAVVGERDGLIGVGDPHDRQRRAEGLLGHAEHRVVDAGQDRRLVEASRAGAGLPAGPHLRPALDRVADVGVDQLDLGREDDRADVDAAELPGRTLAQRSDLFGQPLDELVVDRLLDVDPLDRDADLTGVVEPVRDRGVGRPLEVGVGEHDHRVLAAELEADGGQRLGGLGHHLLARLDRAGEHDVVDEVDQGGAGRAGAGRDREDAVGQAGRGQHLGHQERGQRGDLRGLEDDGVAGGKRRDAVAERVDQWEVPRPDHPDHAERLVADLQLPAAADERRGGRDDLVRQHRRRVLRPELERGNAVGELREHRLVGRLAGLTADRLDDPIAVADHPGAGGHQDPRPLVEARREPLGLGGPGPGDERGEVVRAEVGNVGERLPGRGILYRDSGAVGRRMGRSARGRSALHFPRRVYSQNRDVRQSFPVIGLPAPASCEDCCAWRPRS